MDEIFNSTNPVEGISGAYAVALHMSKNPGTLMVLTTHFAYLTKLSSRTLKFTNYKMNVKQSDNGFIFPYRLAPGISKQYIALDLLEQNGFEKSIIDDAKKIKDKLL
jgi:DNA mismatch repair ATPase MutS